MKGMLHSSLIRRLISTLFRNLLPSRCASRGNIPSFFTKILTLIIIASTDRGNFSMERASMVMDLTFESACKIVKNEHPELAPDIDAFLNIALTTGVTTLAVPIAAASGAMVLTPALIILTAIGTLSNLFGVKNEIFKVGERIISKITSKREQNAHERLSVSNW